MMEQLDLFRDELPEDEKAFSDANTAKTKAQQFYNENWPEVKRKKRYNLLHFKTKIDQVRDVSNREPDTLRMFIRKIKTTATYDDIEKEEASLNCESKEQIIPKWTNDIYTEGNIYTEHFIKLCHKLFSFEFALNKMSNTSYIDKLSKIAGDNLIINFDHRLFLSNRLNTDAFIITDKENKVNDLLTELNSIAKNKGWIITGSFKNFTHDDDLLVDLDEIELFENKISFKEIFFKDYLLLNNAEFLSQQPNTIGWNEMIVPPRIKKNKKVMSDKNYFYTKEAEDTHFIRHELIGENIAFNDYHNIVRWLQGNHLIYSTSREKNENA